MKRTLILTHTLFALLVSAQVMADDTKPAVDLDKRGDRIEERLDNRGDRREERLDNKGDRINNRLDKRANKRSKRIN